MISGECLLGDRQLSQEILSIMDYGREPDAV